MLAGHTPRRHAFTILELVVVMAIVLLLGAIVLPSLMGFWGNNRTKAAVDLATARLSEARGAAMSQGRAYRVCASPDGLQLRICPDESDLAEEANTEADTSPIDRTDSLPKGVVLTPTLTGDSASDGWTTLVTFLPDGTCREVGSEFKLAEEGSVAQVIRVRGLTGVWTVNPDTDAKANGGQP